MSSIVLDFADLTRPGGIVHVTRAAADAVSKEGKGTKEVEVPLDVIPDLPPQRSGATTASPLARRTSAVPSSPTSEEEHPEELTDEVLARRAALGDQQSFTVLVDRHGPALHRHVSRMLADPGVVEDVLQESLLCAWRGLPGFRGEAGVRTWLFAIARRQVFAVSRRSSLTPSPAPANPAGVAGEVVAGEVVAGEVVAGQVTASGDPAEISVGCAFVQAIEAALQRLPEKQRSAWLLKEVEGMTYSEIATVLEVGPGAVRGLLARARATLSAALQGWR